MFFQVLQAHHVSPSVIARSFLQPLVLLLLPLFLPSAVRAESPRADGIRPFLGRWDLTLKADTKERPSWIEVSEAEGQVAVVLVGLTDHATLLKQATIKDSELVFVSPKREEGFPADTTFTAKVIAGRLVGTVTNSLEHWQLTGVRAPSLKAPAALRWGKPVSLFDGKDLNGWTFLSPQTASSWAVKDGELISNGHGSELVSAPKFFNFKLHVEFNAGPKANSGVFLRGRYEVQIETDSESEPASHHTGGVYGFLDPVPEQPRLADRWQSFDITFVGRSVTVVQNGVTVNEKKEIPGITGGALNSDEGKPGPIYLQGSEEGRVAFRNLVVTPALK
jgi:Domain of Unknown Function (DUF1080)